MTNAERRLLIVIARALASGLSPLNDDDAVRIKDALGRLLLESKAEMN